jgi:hypothetical protein
MCHKIIMVPRKDPIMQCVSANHNIMMSHSNFSQLTWPTPPRVFITSSATRHGLQKTVRGFHQTKEASLRSQCGAAHRHDCVNSGSKWLGFPAEEAWLQCHPCQFAFERCVFTANLATIRHKLAVSTAGHIQVQALEESTPVRTPRRPRAAA